MSIDKDTALMVVRSEIDTLKNQYEENEILIGMARIRGQLGLLIHTKVITTSEAVNIEDEAAKARENAIQNMKE